MTDSLDIHCGCEKEKREKKPKLKEGERKADLTVPEPSEAMSVVVNSSPSQKPLWRLTRWGIEW